MPESPVDVAVRISALSDAERLLLVTPGPHGGGILPELLRRFAAQSCTALEADRVRLLAARPAGTPAPPLESPHLARVLARATRLPFRRHSFDAVLSFEALYAIRPPWTVLAEFHRVLVPNGKLVLVEPAAHGWLSALRDKISGPGKRIYTLEELKFRLARSDYQLERVEESARVEGMRWPVYSVCALKIENPAEPVPQFLTAKELLERRRNKPPPGDQLP